MFQHLEEKTKNILHNLGVSKAPVPVETIIHDLGIAMAYAPDDTYSGMLLRKADSTTVMGLNNSEPFRRQRFTMAHELGHYFLDPNKKAFVDEKFSVDHRNNKAGKSENKKERDANAFAAALLMPEYLLAKDFNKIHNEKKVFLEEHLIDLANQYEVSKDAMKFRLLNLGLIRI